MLEINTKNKNYEFKFDGLKIFENENTTKLYKELFFDAQIFIDNKLIKNENIIYINELTKISDLIDMSKKSVIMQLILDNIYDYEILNRDNIISIQNKINNLLGYELLENKDSDYIKLINLIFELIDSDFLNNEILKLIIDKILLEKKLIIIDNVSWLNIELISNYLNNHDFIILTNDIRNLINSTKYFECYVNEQLNEILDLDILINYLQKEINENNIDQNILKDFLNKKDNYTSYKIHQIMKKI